MVCKPDTPSIGRGLDFGLCLWHAVISLSTGSGSFTDNACEGQVNLRTEVDPVELHMATSQVVPNNFQSRQVRQRVPLTCASALLNELHLINILRQTSPAGSGQAGSKLSSRDNCTQCEADSVALLQGVAHAPCMYSSWPRVGSQLGLCSPSHDKFAALPMPETPMCSLCNMRQ